MQPSESPYQFERLDTYTLLTLHPLINDGQWGNVSQVGSEILNRLSAMQKPSLIVDLTPLDYMGSAQVALLVRVWKALKESGGKMAVQCPGEMAKSVLTTAGLASVWKIVDGRQEALAAIGCRESSSSTSSGGSFEGTSTTSSPLLAIMAAIAAGAGVGVAIAGSKSLGVMPSVGLQVVLALLGIATGAFATFRISGFWKLIGGAAAAVSVAVLLWGGYRLGAEQKAPAPSAVESDASAKSDQNSETKKDDGKEEKSDQANDVENAPVNPPAKTGDELDVPIRRGKAADPKATDGATGDPDKQDK